MLLLLVHIINKFALFNTQDCLFATPVQHLFAYTNQERIFVKTQSNHINHA